MTRQRTKSLAPKGAPALGLLLVATLSLGACQRPASTHTASEADESSPVAKPPRVLVAAILTNARLDAPRTETMSFEQIADYAAHAATMVSSPHVLATQGELAAIDLPIEDTEGANTSAPQLTGYAVLAQALEAGPADSSLRLTFSLSFANGQAEETTVVVKPNQLAFFQLDNGLTLVARAEPIRSQQDLERVLQRKRMHAKTLP